MKKNIAIILTLLFFSCKKNENAFTYESEFDIKKFLNESIALYESFKRDTTLNLTTTDSLIYFGGASSDTRELMNPNLVKNALKSDISYYIDYEVNRFDSSVFSEILGKRLRIEEVQYFSRMPKDSIIKKGRYQVKVKKNNEILDVDVKFYTYKILFQKGDSIYRRAQKIEAQKDDKIVFRGYFLRTAGFLSVR